MGRSPWLKAGDVVALVGGEDMVALAEEGWLETLVTWAQPGDRIRWRSLAWEGDTVFEQRRDLNYPALETQLDKMGATVVLCQFGKMESFAGKEGVAAFTEAYGKLLARLSGEKKRRIALVLPSGFSAPQAQNARKGSGDGLLVVHGFNARQKSQTQTPPTLVLPDITLRNDALIEYRDAIRALAAKHGAQPMDAGLTLGPPSFTEFTRDGIHLVSDAHRYSARVLAGCIGIEVDRGTRNRRPTSPGSSSELHTVILAKNRLWFHYTRPQNWAFLAGNRTNQPSSRDHLDRSKRWFPEEMEQWLPLIEAKEQEIWKLAAAPR